MPGNEITLACPDCGAPVHAPAELDGQVARCDACFEVYLREVDHGFLEHYSEFGAFSHRVIAENAARGLVMASPGERKVLALSIFEQFLQAAGDLIGLYEAIKDRRVRPLVDSYLGFELDAARARDFFADLEELSDEELLESLGLPLPERIADLFPAWDRKDLGYAAAALWRAMRNLRKTIECRMLSERALLQAQRDFKRNLPMVGDARWVPDGTLAPNEVATVLVDRNRRRLALRPLAVDESQVGAMVEAIEALSVAAGDLAYVYSLLHRDSIDYANPKLHAAG
jgi:hypothetical protein